VSHTIYEDIIAPFRRITLDDRAQSRRELFWSRLILVASALVAVIVVELLRFFGLTVADLAFAVYGAALGLVPPIMLTLFRDRLYPAV
jgi:Na+(H+)/acetate symporter ActP